MKLRILIIEDNEQNMYLISFILQKHGFEVYQAWDGRQGIEMAPEVKPDLIILDIQLPEMDGYSVARELRNRKGFEQTPIVAVTSYAMVGDREKAMAAGSTGYIEKPINPDTFMVEVMQYLPKENK